MRKIKLLANGTIRIFFILIFLCDGVIAEEAQPHLGIQLPDGFHLNIFAAGIKDAHSMVQGDDGTVYVGSGQAGEVHALMDGDGDGFAEKKKLILKGLKLPAGLAWVQGDLFISEVNRISRVTKPSWSSLGKTIEPEEVYDWFPLNLYQGWKPMVAGLDNKLYIAVGAGCDRCEPYEEIQGTLIRMDIDGGDLEIIATGVRFAGGLAWHPTMQRLYFSDPGPVSLSLGELHPLDELNVLAVERSEFGFPYCHGGIVNDPDYRVGGGCARFYPPIKRFAPGSHPQGLLFYRGNQFPADYKGKLFVAMAGDWSSPLNNGFRVVTMGDGSNADEVKVFAEGWLGEQGQIRGQPTDLLELNDGSLLISDEYQGMIYRISYSDK